MRDQGKIVTVRGLIDSEELGICTAHEHLLFNWLNCMWGRGSSGEEHPLANSQITLENRGLLNRNPFLMKRNLYQDDVELATAELAGFKQAGGRSVVEVTPIGQGRNPAGLKTISDTLNLHIVMSTGFYIQKGHPAYVADMKIEEMANLFAKEITEGVDGTSIRAGFMGDVGTTGTITDDERKVLRACARAHLATGAAIGVHMDPAAEEALTAINILFEEGVRPDRIVMQHMDEHPVSDYHLAVAETGVYLEFDCWGTELYWGPPDYRPEPRDTRRAECVKLLIDRGYVSQLLMGQDIWLRQSLKTFGGEGYDSFFLYGIPRLRQVGVTEEQIRMTIVDNPRKLLPLRV